MRRDPRGRASSTPASAFSNIAASATVRVIGPAVSCETEIGMMPRRLTSPTVGFNPTSPATADRAEDASVGLGADADCRKARRDRRFRCPSWNRMDFDRARTDSCVWPPLELQPEVERVERKFAHSLRFVLPRMTAPASRSRATMNASSFGRWPASASEPAEFTMPAASMLSLIRYRNAVKRPAYFSRLPFGVARVGIGERGRIQLDDGIQHRPGIVKVRDPVEVGLSQRTRRQRAGGHAVASLGGAQFLHIDSRRPVHFPEALAPARRRRAFQRVRRRSTDASQ